MAQIIEWEIGRQRHPDGIRNLPLRVGNTYVVRFIGPPVRFYTYYVNGKSAIVDHPIHNLMKVKYGIDPTTMYAANILLRRRVAIYRAAQNYLIEFGDSVYGQVCQVSDHDPGGKDGSDYAIAVKMARKPVFDVEPLEITRFTQAEKEYLRANVYDLTKFFRSTPDAELESRLLLKT